MKRTFMKFLPIAAAILLATSCSKDGDNNVVTNPVDNPTPAQEQEATPTHSTLTMTFKVSASAGLSKIGIAADNGKSGVAPKFEVGDKIHFADEANKVTADVTLTAKEIGEDPTTAEFVVKDFSGTDEDLAKFRNKETTLTATMGSQLSAISVGYSTLEAAIRANSYQVSAAINYSETQTDIEFTEQTSYLEISSPQSTVDINGVTYTLTDGKVYVAAPANTLIESLALGLCNTTKQGTIHTITRHYLPKAFSVSGTKTVTFSCGNLQYNPTTFKWRFAPHQWDKCHAAIDEVGESYKSWTDSKWTDLFGYGMWLSGESPTQTEKDNSKYLPNVTSGEFSGTSAISSDWTTLTIAEWQYLFNSRVDRQYGAGSVDGVNGIIILPDDWTYPTDMSESAPSSFTSGASAWSNAYTEVDWQKMEAAGAVFLPATGFRDGTTAYHQGDGGSYWSSSVSEENYAWSLGLYSEYIILDINGDRSFGYSVRLVRSL